MENVGRLLGLHCGTKRDQQNQFRILAWMVAWIGAWLVAVFAIKYGWLAAGAPLFAAALVTMGLGVATMLAYRRFLREADELIRKIELEALALTVGAGLVGGLGYLLLERSGVVEKPGSSVILVLMMFTYAIAVVIGQRRYS